MPRPQFRFTVNANGHEKQILAIVETSDGSLEFFPTSHREVDHPNGYRTISKNYYISLHPTDKEDWFTININQKYVSESVTKRAYIEPGESHFTIPIFARLCPSPLINYPALKFRKGDTKASIGEFDPNKETLVYVVFCRNSGADSILTDKPLRHIIGFFSRFSVFVVPLILRVPSTASGRIAPFGDFNERWNDEDISSIRSPEVFTGLPSNIISDALRDSISAVRPAMIKFLTMYGAHESTILLSKIVEPLSIERNG